MKFFDFPFQPDMSFFFDSSKSYMAPMCPIHFRQVLCFDTCQNTHAELTLMCLCFIPYNYIKCIHNSFHRIGSFVWENLKGHDQESKQ